MADVAIQFHPDVFNAGKPLAHMADNKHKARYTMSAGCESKPHIAHGTWYSSGRDGYASPPNSPTISVHWGGPSWMDLTAFNNLSYQEIRAQVANEVDRGILQVLTTAGAVATSADIRAGTVA